MNRSLLDALSILMDRLDGTEIVWALTGSLGHALQGVPLEAHDVDVQTDERGAYSIEDRLAGFVVRAVGLSSTDRIRSHFGAFSVGGVVVEVMGALQKRLPDGSWEPPVDVVSHRKYVTAAGRSVPVLDLAYEADAYEILGRTDRAALLRRHVRGRR